MNNFATLTGASAFAVFGAFDAAAAATSAVVVDTRLIESSFIDGVEIAELSGLAFDRAKGVLYAVSDRAFLFLFRFSDDWELDGLAIDTVHDLMEVFSPDGKFGPEAIAIMEPLPDTPDDGFLTILSEDGPTAINVTRSGKFIGRAKIPDAVAKRAGGFRKNKGLESLAYHPVHGYLTMPETFDEPGAAGNHVLHTAGKDIYFPNTIDGQETLVKDMTISPDNRLVLIERTENGSGYAPFLRFVDIDGCPDKKPCDTEIMPVTVAGHEASDFEGITFLTDDLVLLVSDDRHKGQASTVFALVRLQDVAK